MRLIDADAFKQQLAAMAMRESYPVEKVNAMIKLIDMQPTVLDMVDNSQSNAPAAKDLTTQQYREYLDLDGEMESLEGKKILDVTCGSKTIWFDKDNPAAVFCDKRCVDLIGIWKSENGKGRHTCMVSPDVQCDFTCLPFPNDSFPLVVFDPPHLKDAGETAWMTKKYGKLDENWPQMIHDGFQECMRVLKEDGVLIFKWSECQIPAKEVWDAIGQKPLFGHRSGKASKTFWGCYMKGVK